MSSDDIVVTVGLGNEGKDEEGVVEVIVVSVAVHVDTDAAVVVNDDGDDNAADDDGTVINDDGTDIPCGHKGLTPEPGPEVMWAVLLLQVPITGIARGSDVLRGKLKSKIDA